MTYEEAREGIDLLRASVDRVAAGLPAASRSRLRRRMVWPAAAAAVLAAAALLLPSLRRALEPQLVEVLSLRIQGAETSARVIDARAAGAILVYPDSGRAAAATTAPLLCGGLALPAAAGAEVPGTSVAYHLRVVRVAGAKASRGAAIGCKGLCGTPILVPDDESWGSPEQLAALAKALEGDRADPVTGYIVRPSPEGGSRFEATVYPGETVLSMEFEARMPEENARAHELTLRLTGIEPDASPLAEARLLVHAERTVAIAAPSPVEGEWVVLAVTPMDPDSVRARLAKVEEVRTLDSTATIEPPTLVHREVPRYPEVARRDVRSGRVVLEAVIDREGVPRAIKVLRVPEGCEDLAAASVDSVGRWRYEPATLDGRPVPVYFTVVFQFVLD